MQYPVFRDIGQHVQGGPDTPSNFVLGNPGSGSHVGCLPRSFRSPKVMKLPSRFYKLPIFHSYIARTNESNPYITYFLL